MGSGSSLLSVDVANGLLRTKFCSKLFSRVLYLYDGEISEGEHRIEEEALLRVRS